MFFPLQGGSFGRGTDLRGGCDAELVIFLNCFESYEDQGPRRAEILDDMRAQLESQWQDSVPGLTLNFPEQTMTEALQLQLVSPALESWMDVSLLPVFDAVGEGCPACALEGLGNISCSACDPLCDPNSPSPGIGNSYEIPKVLLIINA